MKRNTAYKNSDAALLRGMGVSKSKLIIAAVLIAIMTFMWLRLLLFNKSSDASAADVTGVDKHQPVNATTAAPELTYIQLPVVRGRHDVLTADVFRPRNRRIFKRPDNTQNAGGASDSEGGFLTTEDIRKIEASITLDGTIADARHDNREAFINGKLVSVGSKVAVEYNKRSVELTVTEIYRNKVVLRVGEFAINVLMFQVDP